MNLLKTCLAVLAGYLLGAALHPASLKAQYGSSDPKVMVQEVKYLHPTGQAIITSQGSQVIGFSCTRNEDGESQCYIASTK